MIVTRKGSAAPHVSSRIGSYAGAATTGCHDAGWNRATRPPARRLGYLYVPMGAHRPMWNLPGKDLTALSPTLSPLANVREYCTVIDNLELKNAYPGTHATSNAGYLAPQRPSGPKAATITWGPRSTS